MDRAAIVLAAGAGTRMKSATPKVLHQVAGLPILGHVITGLKGAGVSRIVVVTAPGADQVRAYATSLGADSVVQDKQLGTGHAAAAAAPALKNFKGEVMVAYGDMPLLTGEAFAAAFAARPKDGLAIVAFHAADPGAYGRVLLDKDGILDRIVEFKDATAAERKTDLCNAGLMVAEAERFFALAAKLDNKNAQGEFYLTDIPTLAKQDGARCAVALIGETEALGVNSRAELAQAERRMQDRLRGKALAAGVTMTAPETVFLSHDTVLQADVEIEPFVVLGVGVTVKSGARIRSHSHLEGAVVEARAIIGPFARLRPGAVIGEDSHIGNFVEVKNSAIGKGTKANHLTYLGDATVGADVNIGAGTITCNYDGFGKYRTEIGDGAFIGSDTALVAPVKVGAGAITGAGSVITKDVAPDALAVARGSQTEKPGWAKLFRDLKRKKRDQA
jgi:bifunctional UDP-N-acetylglucosamine pyrophosphorylase/glucosamine-1-phosphate N-acetyltransferase